MPLVLARRLAAASSVPVLTRALGSSATAAAAPQQRPWYPGHSVIDSTVAEDAGSYYRFTKDERSADPANQCGNFITEEDSPDLRDTAWDFVAGCIGLGNGDGLAAGEGPTAFRANTGSKWYLFIDEFDDRGHVRFETDDLNSGRGTKSQNYSLPGTPRHGTVLALTRAEHDRSRATYPAAD